MSSRGRPVGNGAPRTSRPTRCAWRACADMARCVVGADVLGGPRTRGRSRWRPVGNGAPRTSRPTRCAHGVRVRTWHALADMARGVVGADVPGGPRARGRPRCRSVGAARRGRRALPGARMACVCGHGAVRGRGRRPRRPAYPWASHLQPGCRHRGRPWPKMRVMPLLEDITPMPKRKM